MSLKVEYTPLMLRRAQQIWEDVEATRPDGRQNKTRDEEYCQTTYNLSFDYIRGIGTRYQRPSLRVLKNLGLQVWIRDPATGEEEQVSMDSVVEWSPRNAAR